MDLHIPGKPLDSGRSYAELTILIDKYNAVTEEDTKAPVVSPYNAIPIKEVLPELIQELDDITGTL